MRYSTSVQLWQWYLEGKPLPVIADMASRKYDTHVSTATVYRVIRKHRGRLHRRDIDDRRVLLLDEIGKLDRLEQEYWEGYFRSIAASTDATTERLVTSDPKEIKNLDVDADLEIDEFDDSKEDDDADVLGETEPTDANLFGGWARIEREQDTRQSGQSIFGNDGNYRRARKAGRRARYQFVDAAHYEAEEVKEKPPAFTFSRKIVKTCGDTKFLAGVQWCIDRRCKLLGLDAPSKSITARTSVEQMRQMGREMLIEKGLDPDLELDGIMDEVGKILDGTYAPVE